MFSLSFFSKWALYIYNNFKIEVIIRSILAFRSYVFVTDEIQNELSDYIINFNNPIGQMT